MRRGNVEVCPAIRPSLEAKFFQMRHIVEPARDHLVAFDNNLADRAVRRTVEGKGAHARCDRHRRPDHATMDHDGNRWVRVPRCGSNPAERARGTAPWSRHRRSPPTRGLPWPAGTREAKAVMR